MKAHHYYQKLMGTAFGFSAIHIDPDIAWNAIRAAVGEMVRIENLISSWKKDSQTSWINRNSGRRPVVVDEELFLLIKRSLRISILTRGAFDISTTIARYFWNFNKKEGELPTEAQKKKILSLINYQNIEIREEDHSVFLKEPGMKIGFGGIGKGYAAMRGRVMMENLGVKSGVINAAGDVYVWGPPLNAEYWNVHIPDPENRSEILTTVKMSEGAVVSSGSNESFALNSGRRYSHIIDPQSGHPTQTIKTASIICPNPELADALATAVSVLGRTQGMNLIDQLKGIECVILDNNNQLHYSTIKERINEFTN